MIHHLMYLLIKINKQLPLNDSRMDSKCVHYRAKAGANAMKHFLPVNTNFVPVFTENCIYMNVMKPFDLYYRKNLQKNITGKLFL